MKTFYYKAYDKAGAKIEGESDASNKAELLVKLKGQGYLVFDVSEKTATSKFAFNLDKKVSLADIEFLTSELSLLLQSGVRIDKGLNIIRRTKSSPAIARLLDEISADISKGSSLSAAMEKHESVFDRLYINLVALGEESGNLPEIFAKLAQDLRFKQDLQRKVITSMTYPFVILGVCVLCVFFVFNFIVPKLSVLFAEAENLPWYTQALLGVSQWMQSYQWSLVLFVIASVFGFVIAMKRPHIKRYIQDALLKLPGVKGVIIITERIRFNSALSMMLQSGLPVDKSLKLAQNNLKNHAIQREVRIATEKIQQGESLTTSLRQTSLYPDFYASLLEVAEESGKLSHVFEEIANRSRAEFESWTQRATTLIEPLMILLMGGIVGGVVIVMLLSMVSVNDVGF